MISSLNETMKDVYPRPGTRIKQWVVDARREQQWERDTCPRIVMNDHEDNTGAPCRNCYGSVPWTYLDHDCCQICGDEHERIRMRPDVQAWLTERAARPAIEPDHSKLSDEIEPDLCALTYRRPLLR